MKRFHVNLRVADLEASTRFYTEIFGVEPVVSETDYRKWMLDDPRINFSIEPQGACEAQSSPDTGVAHLGLQVDSQAELEEMRARIGKAAAPSFDEGETQCCYAHSFKSWTRDPDGVVWETFFTDGQRRDYGAAPRIAETLS
ncbi:MAG: VOC family protein [Erythrobacter sp.]|uniref:VOC family protein n=1 Tax=Erythrobacter sp. TaxID=1042 RepID=UPI002615323F|nr:VOC family protein [Erythrobacter sp.]MDJ0978641.1 VOC family protein [Erythrobacter sp.]